MAKYFKLVECEAPFNRAYQEERCLCGMCRHHDMEHDWILLPLEEGQKQYVMCVNCLEVSHL